MLGEKLKIALGMTSGVARLYVLAAEELKKARRNPFVAHTAFTEAVVQDAELLRALIADEEFIRATALKYLQSVALDMKSARESGAGPRCNETPAISAGDNSAGEEGQARPESHRTYAPAPAEPFKPNVTALRSVAAASQSALDTFRVRNGRSIGDVRRGEIDGLVKENTIEARVLKRVKQHHADAAPSAKVRDLISPATLEIFIHEAEMANDE